ncbi:hypothetical protein FA95DRAFT_1604471 [Auriscalpium vulgare]|uniref:Uncharacterized protein n=1 Tax=Auriscalpium vulgare TaxID=40419 RepID=A0ACB8RZS1_9AGAM|nr:hypothetical protein FA95DRAFT_1604471 [Auriscalpium vulgare]
MTVLRSAICLSVLACATAALGGADAEPFHHLLTKAGDCKFSLKGRQYNLCPLFGHQAGHTPTRRSIDVQQSTPPTITSSLFSFSFGAALARDDSLPSHEQCPDGTWVCLTVSNRRPKHGDEEARVTQVIPLVANFSDPALSAGEKFGVYAQHAYYSKEAKAPSALRLRMFGGQYVQKPHRVMLDLLCDPGEGAEPSPTWSWNGTYAFTWKTKYACASGQPKGAPAEDHTHEPPPEDATPPADDLLTTPPMVGQRVRSVVTILLLSGGAIFGVAYLILRPPMAVRRHTTPLLRAFRRSRFRSAIGESKLLRWAQEDMALLEEEDEMVNAHGDIEFEAFNEQIPLKPSPGRVFANYGTAQRDH